MRPVTEQADGQRLDDEHGVEPVPALAAILLRDGHAQKLGVLQELDIVPGILLGAIDLGRALRHRSRRQLADARLQLDLVGRQSGRVHESYPWPWGSTLKTIAASLRPRTATLPRSPEDELIAAGLARAVGDENARAVVLVQLLQPRREIDRVAQQGEGQPPAGADRAADHVARADADAGGQGHAHVAEGAAADGALDVDGGAHRGAGMVLAGERHVEGGEQAVADEGVDHAAMGADRLQHGLEILVQRRHEVVGCEMLGDGGEARNVGEQDGGLARLAGQHALAFALEDGGGHALVDIAAEGLAEALALAQAADHVVELPGELADLVVGGDHHALAEIALGDPAHGARQVADRPEQRPGDEIGRDRHAHERDADDVGDLDLEPVAFVGEEGDDDRRQRRDRDHHQGDDQLGGVAAEEQREVAAVVAEDEGAEPGEIVADDEVGVGEDRRPAGRCRA